MDETGDKHPLTYAGADLTAPNIPRGVIALVVINVLAGIASLSLVPLALHIYACSASEKWCHLQAFFFGVPGGIVLAVLAGITASASASMRHSRWILLIAWLPIAMVATVLLALFVAVAHNS